MANSRHADLSLDGGNFATNNVSMQQTVSLQRAKIQFISDLLRDNRTLELGHEGRNYDI